MTHDEVLSPILHHRGNRVVISTMTSAGIWPNLSRHKRDFAYLPSSMGQAIPLGIGLALSQPGLGIIVLSGDGGLLMNLGCLVTLAERNLPVCIVLMENGLYEVTGGQKTVGAGRVDFASLARASGIAKVGTVETHADWEQDCESYLISPNPSFVLCKVKGRLGQKTPAPPESMNAQIARLSQSLRASNRSATPLPGA